MFNLTSAVLLVVAVATYLLFKKRKPKFPPGPLALPLIGNIHQVIQCDKDFQMFLEKYRKIYGNVYTIELSGHKRVVISRHHVLKKLMEEYADFTSNRTFQGASAGVKKYAETRPGMMFAAHPDWRTLRVLIQTHLRQGGVGKPILEEKVLDEFNYHADHFIAPSLNKPLDVQVGLKMATANVISMLIFGDRHTYTDKSFNDWMEYIRSLFTVDLNNVVFRNIPFYRYLPNKITGRARMFEIKDFLTAKADAWVADAKANLNNKEEGGFLKRLFEFANSPKASKENYTLTDENAAAIVVDLFIAGADTSSVMISWSVLFMCAHPEIQQKVQQEIDEVLGQRPVAYKDLADLPYTDAVIHEVMRLGNIFPLCLPHLCEKDLAMEGTVIPAGAEILLNITSVMQDPDVFEEPEKFKPERFLAEDGAKKKDQVYSTFGIGRRMCVGRSLAKMEIFIFFVSFMQRYNVRYSGKIPEQFKGIGQVVTSPPQFKAIFSTR